MKPVALTRYVRVRYFVRSLCCSRHVLRSVVHTPANVPCTSSYSTHRYCILKRGDEDPLGGWITLPGSLGQFRHLDIRISVAYHFVSPHGGSHGN